MDAPQKNKEPESVQRFLSSVCEEAYSRGHCPVMWSTPGEHYNRETCKMEDQELQQKLYAIGGKPYAPQEITVSLQIGDINGDGSVNIADAVALQKYLIAADDRILENADLSDDGIINAADLSLLKHLIIG